LLQERGQKATKIQMFLKEGVLFDVAKDCLFEKRI
jgi:hypothetical protein